MASNLTPPDALKNIKPYLTLASQLEVKNERAISYYCKLYSLQTGMSINKSAPECKKFLLQLMDMVETNKSQMKNDEAIQSQVVGQSIVETYALKIFEKADEDDRSSRFTKNLVKQFYSAGLFFDVLNYFGELSEDLVQKKQYAKRKAMYLNKCFQTGEQPIPGPIGPVDAESNASDEYTEQQSSGIPAAAPGKQDPPYSNFTGLNLNSSTNTSTTTTTTTTNEFGIAGSAAWSPSSYESRGAANRPAPSAAASSSASAYVAEETTSNISPDNLAKAQKLCKYASSALQYEDVPTAISNLEQCLKILKTSQH